jgi:hypothetical protein
VQRVIKVVAVVLLVATLLVISSIPAFARPLRGGVPLQTETPCEVFDGNHPLFRPTAPEPPEDPTEPPIAACWHVSQGPGLERASDVPPLRN